jgi:hypothetical protein
MHMRQPGQLRALLAASLQLFLVNTIAFAQLRPNGLSRREIQALSQGETVTLIPDQALQLGTPIEQELGPNEIHGYTIKLEENMFVQVVVEQRGIDVMVLVGAPDGKNLGDFDSPNGTQGPENLSFVAVTAGTYRVIVRPLDQNDKTTGKYEIKLVEVRQATEQELKSAKSLEVVKAKGLALLNDIDDILAQMRSPQTRIRGQLQAAQLLTQADEKRSLKYLNDAANGMKEFIANLDPMGGDYIRNFSNVTQLRSEIANALLSRDPEAALVFLRSTRMQFDPYNNEREQVNQEVGLELRIASEIAANDPKRAIQLARQSLKKGYSADLPYTISRLKQKNPELATELADEVVAKLMGEKLLKSGYGASLASHFVRGCRITPVERQQGLGEPTVEPLIPTEKCRDLVEKSYRDALAFTMPPPNQYTPDRDAAWNLLHGLKALGSELDAVVEGGSAAVTKKLIEFDGTKTLAQTAYEDTQNKLNETRPIENSLELIEKVPEEMRESLYTQLANNAASRGEGARAREILNAHLPNPYQRRQAMMNVDLQEMYHFVGRGKVEDALRTIGTLRTARERAGMLTNIARQIGPGQKRLVAIRLLEQARALLAPGPQAEDQQQMHALLELARAFARYDAKRAFEMVEPLVDQVNDICTAARTLEGFGLETFEDDELDMQNGNSISNAVTQMTGALGALALTNFERAKSMADRLRLPEARLRAYLDIAQQTMQAR